MASPNRSSKVAVAIPAYKCRRQIEGVLRSLPPIVDHIFLVDDACPEETGRFAEELGIPNLTVLRHPQNQGVGGAIVSAYRAALRAGYEIIVKVDGDGQMNPALIPALIAPILAGEADYAKGNRFFFLQGLAKMPVLRLIGNAGLSMINKMVSGYWNVMDPTNGFVAIHANALRMIEIEKLSRRYFFESDLLFRLSIIKAVVVDVPMFGHYGDETSNLSVSHSLFTFPFKYLNRMLKRYGYNYFIRDFSIGTIALVGGVVMSLAGFTFGIYNWVIHARQDLTTPLGTIMLAVLPMIFGFQALILFIQIDMSQVPVRPLQKNGRLIRELLGGPESSEG